MAHRRVVVTGMSSISPVGVTLKETWANILAGQTGVKKINEEWITSQKLKC